MVMARATKKILEAIKKETTDALFASIVKGGVVDSIEDTSSINVGN